MMIKSKWYVYVLRKERFIGIVDDYTNYNTNYKCTKEAIQTFVDVNDKPHSIWEDMVEQRAQWYAESYVQ